LKVGRVTGANFFIVAMFSDSRQAQSALCGDESHPGARALVAVAGPVVPDD